MSPNCQLQEDSDSLAQKKKYSVCLTQEMIFWNPVTDNYETGRFICVSPVFAYISSL